MGLLPLTEHTLERSKLVTHTVIMSVSPVCHSWVDADTEKVILVNNVKQHFNFVVSMLRPYKTQVFFS